jgi:hypothetical protein
METFFLLIFIPLIVAAIAKFKFHHTVTWKEVAVQTLSINAILAGIWFTGTSSQTSDFEIWNGQITGKNRHHDTYMESYSCNCRTVCSGSGSNRSCSTRCDTCYRKHYTVDWYLTSTIGNIRLQYLDRTSRSVYNSPDPSIYTNAAIGGICSTENSYTNYVKAVPESLFSKVDESQLEEFEELIPAYPRVYSIYKVNRVLVPGTTGINTDVWNNYLSEYQKTLGNSHQVNIILVLVNTADQMYRHALERAWIGGKKNDIIVMIGSSEFPKIDWVDTITLGNNSGNELMTVQMRDSIMEIGTIEDHVPVIDTIAKTVTEKFDRKPMADYDYLKDEIEPPTWVVILAFFLSIALSIGATIYFHKEDPFS